MKHGNRDSALPLGPLMFWVVLVAFLGLLGLCYVQMKHRLKVDGDRCRDLEHAVSDLDEKLKVADNEVMRLKSRPALERRRQEGFIRVVQVQDSRMLRLRPQAPAAAALSAEPGTEETP